MRIRHDQAALAPLACLLVLLRSLERSGQGKHTQAQHNTMQWNNLKVKQSNAIVILLPGKGGDK